MNFQLFYTTSGHVGRKTWWLTQLITILLLILFLALLMTIEQHASGISGPHTIVGYLRGLASPADITFDISDLSPGDTALLWTVAAGFFMTVWVHFVIEVKRWHDLRLSGYCVLLRFVPALVRHFLPEFGATIFYILFVFAAIYLLGFRPGISSNGVSPGRPE